MTTPPGSTRPGPTPLGALPGEVWRTRPVRPRSAGVLGGVCAAVGRRYGVDPVLVRVAFVVATVLGGGGVPLYLVSWLVLPREGDTASPVESLLGRGTTSMSRGKVVVLLVVAALTTTGLVGGGPLLGSGLLGAAVLLAGLGLLHRHRPVPPVAPVAPAPVDLGKPGGEQQGAPPAWDPLGAAPFAWDLPEPAVPAPPRPPRSRHTPVTLGVALLVVAVAVALRVVTGWEWLSPSRVGALALAVVGAGLVLGALRRRGWGLLPVTGPLIGFVVLSSLAGGLDRGEGPGGVGEQRWAPTTTATLQEHYGTGVGDATLDLTGLALTGDRTVRVDSGIGDVAVFLPAGLDVDLTCESGLGEASCPWAGLDPGDDGSGGPVLTLDVHAGVGDLAVRRG